MRRAGLRINRYELLLAAVISARATSFIFSKLALEAMDTFNLLAVRCLLAFAGLAALLPALGHGGLHGAVQPALVYV